MLEETIADEPRHVLPIVIPLVGDLFLQDRADGNHGCKGISEDQELQKKFAAQNTKRDRKNDGDDPPEFEHRSEQLKDPQVRQSKTANPPVTRPENIISVCTKVFQPPLLHSLPHTPLPYI